MRELKYYILTLMMTLLAGGCSDEVERENADVDFCVRATWQNGLDAPSVHSSRALTATNILAGGTNDIEIATEDYPATIDVKCSDGTDFTLTKGSALCDDHSDYWQYSANNTIYKDKKIERDDLTFSFKAVIDEDGNPLTTNDGDRLVGEADKNSITEKTSTGQRHMLVTLHHTKALLRFAFKVSEKYDKVRYIRVTGISLNGSPCTLVDKVLTTSGQLISYAYIDPTVVTTSYENTIRCTYNIYDKDEATDAHLTRKDVTAQNHFTLGTLKDASSNPVTTIRAGYYYDLNVTLNPDYLYVLAEHDNKHITIN